MNTETETNVSRAIKSLRTGRNLTIKNISSSLGISQTLYHNYETGIKIPDMGVIFKLCVFYNLNIELFVFLLCQDYVTAGNITSEDMFNIHTYNKISEAEHIELIEKYKTLPDDYKSAVCDFVEAAIICSKKAPDEFLY